MTPVSDERLAELLAYEYYVVRDYDELQDCLRELQAFRAERTRQMQEGR